MQQQDTPSQRGWTSQFPKAPIPSDALYKSLRLPRTYPKVAQWLFAEPHLPFHSNAPLLTPHAFTGSVALRACHSFENITPVFDPFGVDERVTPTVANSSAPPPNLDSDSSKPAGYIVDILFTPVARATPGIIVGYSLASGQSFDPYRNPFQSGTFRDKDHLNGRFAYDMDNDHVIIVVNGLTPLVSGIIDLSFLGQSRHRYFYTVPKAPYGPHRLPSRVLVMLTGLEIKVYTPDGESDEEHLTITSVLSDNPLQPPDLRLRDGDINDNGGISYQDHPNSNQSGGTRVQPQSYSLSRNYAEQLSEIVSDLHNLALSMHGVYKGPYMRRDVFDLSNPKKVRSSINGQVSGAHLPPTRDYRRSMAIYAWQGYTSCAYGLRSHRREAQLYLSLHQAQQCLEPRPAQTPDPPPPHPTPPQSSAQESPQISEEETPSNRRNATTQTELPEFSFDDIDLKDCQRATESLFSWNSGGSNKPLNSDIEEDPVDPAIEMVDIARATARIESRAASCTAWTKVGDVEGIRDHEIVSIDTMMPASGPGLPIEATVNQSSNSSANHTDPGGGTNPTELRAGIGTPAAIESTSGHANLPIDIESRSACGATPFIEGFAPSLALAVPVGPTSSVFTGMPFNGPSVSMRSDGLSFCDTGIPGLGAPAFNMDGGQSSSMDMRSATINGTINSTSLVSGTNTGFGLPINTPITKDRRTYQRSNAPIEGGSPTASNEEEGQAEKVEARRRKNRESAMRCITRRREREEQQSRELADCKEKLMILAARRSRLLAENNFLRKVAASWGLMANNMQAR